MRIPRQALFAALLTGVFATGFIGQGHLRIGSRPASVAVSAAAVEVIGGAGTRQPARAIAQIVITNQGSDEVRVDHFEAGEPNAVPTWVDPRGLEIGAGRAALVNVTLMLDCRSRAPLALPVLHIALPDAALRSLPVAGAGRLVEACQRSGPTTRSLAFTPMRDDAGLALRVTAPAARPVRVLAVRAGGVRLEVAGLPMPVGEQPSTLRLTPPASCPPAWRTAGVPGTLDLDTDDGPAPAGGASATAALQWKGGTVLTDWLLATACAFPDGGGS